MFYHWDILVKQQQRCIILSVCLLVQTSVIFHACFWAGIQTPVVTFSNLLLMTALTIRKLWPLSVLVPDRSSFCHFLMVDGQENGYFCKSQLKILLVTVLRCPVSQWLMPFHFWRSAFWSIYTWEKHFQLKSFELAKRWRFQVQCWLEDYNVKRLPLQSTVQCKVKYL